MSTPEKIDRLMAELEQAQAEYLRANGWVLPDDDRKTLWRKNVGNGVIHLGTREAVGWQRAKNWSDENKADENDEDEEPVTMFRNLYECPRCGHKWPDDYPSCPDDDCPECGCRHITPYESQELDEDGEPVDVSEDLTGEPPPEQTSP